MSGPMAGATGELYSPGTGFIYVFNLIVGTGALTMPKAFAAAGWGAGVILMFILSFMSYLSTTFVIEVMSIANAIIRHQKKVFKDLDDHGHENGINGPDREDGPDKNRYQVSRPIREGEMKCRTVNTSEEENQPLLGIRHLERKYQRRNRGSSYPEDDIFNITERVEMGQMADMFFNNVGRTLFYLCIIIYLYGDLAIYAAAVPKTLRDVACGNLSCTTINSTVNRDDSDICWGHSITRNDAYRILLGVFVLVLGPFTFFNVQKTKYLQIATSVIRWVSFLIMIIITIIKITTKENLGHPKAFDITGVPTLFGVCVYSFMCQHSLPSLITPIRNKSYLSRLMAVDYSVILVFYFLLCLTAIFAFDNAHLMDMYTLNFQDSCDATDVTWLRYFIGLFPVFTLSANFPIIAVTLRNNLKAMLSCNRSSPYPFFVDRIIFPLLALVPPVGVAFVTNDLTSLVGYTGSYAGSGVQYVIPACLVLLARKQAASVLGVTMAAKNSHRSTFKRRLWILVLLMWALICLIFVTVNHIIAGTTVSHSNGTLLDSKWSLMNMGRYLSI